MPRPQAELVRVALSATGRLVVSRTAPGRGAWLCPHPGDCLTAAVRHRAFERAFRVSTRNNLAARSRSERATTTILLDANAIEHLQHEIEARAESLAS